MRLRFIETPAFSLQVQALAADDSLRALQAELLNDPEKGDLMPRCGGFRKARMRLPGRGKRGGGRVVYLHAKGAATVMMVYLYGKAAKTKLTAAEEKTLTLLAAQYQIELRP